MKVYNIETHVSVPFQNVTYVQYKELLTELKKNFLKYDNFSLYHEFYDDTNALSCISFKVNGMENIVFSVDLQNSVIYFSFRKISELENKNRLIYLTDSPIVTLLGKYKDADDKMWYEYMISFQINAIEKDNKLIAFLPYRSGYEYNYPVIFGTDLQDRNYMYMTGNEIRLYYDDPDYIPCSCDLDNLSTNVDGYVYLKKSIGIYKNGAIYGTTSQPVIICSTALGTSYATYLNLIDINGVKYRQLRAMIWMEDE